MNMLTPLFTALPAVVGDLVSAGTATAVQRFMSH